MRDAPPWWDWPLELSPHLLKRMVDRGFNEVSLRTMLDDAQRVARLAESLRCAVHTRFQGREWVVVVEPDPGNEVIVVITAYAPERQ